MSRYLHHQQQESTTRIMNSKDDEIAMGMEGLPELDLHGFQQSPAIQVLTRFLEMHSKSWVHIITGSGSHSQHGPVLKPAVERLLKLREMEYKITSAGSFLVNGASG